MRFGDYIREKRRRLKWTQPQAAKEIGIEQSYLSKLESGKSHPSEDVFSSLKEVYKLDLAELKNKLFPGELDRLREISEVRSLILSNEKDERRRAQYWVTAGVIALTMGGACLGASFLAQDNNITQFQYKSDGVSQLDKNINTPKVVGDGSTKDMMQKSDRQEMTSHISEKYKSLEEYKGVAFFENVPDGRRMWRFYGSTQDTVQSPLRWFMIPAIALILGGFGCFFASYRKP